MVLHVKKKAAVTFFMLAMSSLLVRAQDRSFTVKGTVEGSAVHGKLYLVFLQDGKKAVIDSAMADKGKFVFHETSTAFPVQVFLRMSHEAGEPVRSTKDALLLFADEGETSVAIKDSIRYGVVSGSTSNQEMKKYLDFIAVPGGDNYGVNGLIVLQIRMGKSYRPTGDTTRTATGGTDDRLQQQMNEQQVMLEKRNQLLGVRKALQEKYILANPDSYFSMYALKEIAGFQIEVAEVEPLFKDLSARQQNSPDGKALQARIEKAKTDPHNLAVRTNDSIQWVKRQPAFKIGETVTDFTLDDANGKPVKLTDFRGKYVLIDFWASWCGPCRQENPNVIKAYNQFKDKNFTVLGVALESSPSDREKWLGAIKKDGLPWTEVTDFMGFKSPVAREFKVEAIPTNFLVDPAGKVIAFNLRGETLQDKLTQVLGN